MAQLAILGHETRGKEVIEILEMLGGKNVQKHYCNNKELSYYIDESCKWIRCSYTLKNSCNIVTFTLEEFLEKFPYKVGDKVQHKGATSCGSFFEVEKMQWVNNQVKYTILWHNNCHVIATAEDLQPYKEENMEEKSVNRVCPISKYKTTGQGTYAFKIADGYKFDSIDENGNIIVKSIKPQYPKTYKECFNICFGNHHHIIQVVGLDGLGNNKELFQNFIKLKICRDAYWKIAGEQMGLGKPWEPDWEEKDGGYRYCICNFSNKIELSNEWLGENYILSFPTAEMRDAFFENFKELIEKCKEFL